MTDYVTVPREQLDLLLMARGWFEGDPSGALGEIEHRVKAMLAAAPQPNSQGSLDGSPAALPKYKVTVINNEHPDGIPLEQWMRRSAAAAPQQPAAQPEPMARFCPGCGSVGPVPEKYRDCCPDGDKARMIPEALARHCRDLFQLALSAPGDALHPQQPAAQPASAEPVAEVTGEWHSKHIAWLPGSPDLPLGAKLYTLPRDPAEVMRLAEDAQRWRFWRQHWQLLTRMEVARPAGIDLSRRGVYSPDEMDEVTDAALARAVGAAE
jgi:hypothetical protein